MMKRTKMPKCKCGCGKPITKIGNKFIYGHNLKIKLDSTTEQKRREKISKTMKEFLSDPEERRKRGLVWKGRHHSEETKKKLSKLRTGVGNGMYGKKLSEEQKQKISEANKGRKHSEETRKKISKANKGKVNSLDAQQRTSKTLKEFFKHNPNPFKGKHHTEESKQKMSKSLKGEYKREKASNWQGGKSSFPYAKGWDYWLIEEIKMRDKRKCQNPNCDKPHHMLDVHHIDYNKQNLDHSNLITLCKRCHGKTQKNRDFWTEYYQKIMKNKTKTTNHETYPPTQTKATGNKHRFNPENCLVIPHLHRRRLG